jgi:60 kDa SS-A/Ro ribonucleoprotein
MKLNLSSLTDIALASHPAATRNHEQGLAFEADPRLALYLSACTCLFEDKFYTHRAQELTRLRALIQRNDRKFVLQLAHYARTTLHLRTLPLILLAEASQLGESPQAAKADLRAYVPRIVRRADEPAELLAYWITAIGQGRKHKLPNALKKGLVDALKPFDAYQLAKYNRAGKVRLRDVLRLVHPKPSSPEQATLWRQVLDDQLPTPDTWEVLISTQGAKRETWEAIAPRMGIMALVRNLRNFEKHGATSAIERALAVITDPEQVHRSQLLPFRWLAAEREVTDPRLRNGLRTALELSLNNLPRWSGSSAVFVDLSGSMHSPLSSHSSLQYVDVATLMGAMARHLCGGEVLVGAFGETYRDVFLPAGDSVLSNTERLRQSNVGHATNAWLSLQALRQRKQKVDRVLIFSDMQCYDSSQGNASLAAQWQAYRREVNRDALLYSVDLSGYGTLQFPPQAPGVVFLAGWSERVLDIIPAYETRADILAQIASTY